VLIITRRPGERIMLGDDTRIHIMEIAGNNVRVGVEAPKSIPVYREEIWTQSRKRTGLQPRPSKRSCRVPRPVPRRGTKRCR